MLEDEERHQASQTGDEDASETVHQAAGGGEGAHPSRAAQPIEGSGQQTEQTQTPAPENDTAYRRSQKSAQSKIPQPRLSLRVLDSGGGASANAS